MSFTKGSLPLSENSGREGSGMTKNGGCRLWFPNEIVKQRDFRIVTSRTRDDMSRSLGYRDYPMSDEFELHPHVVQFDLPVLVSIDITGDVDQYKGVAVWTRDSREQPWKHVRGALVDWKSGSVQFKTCHFSFFMVAAIHNREHLRQIAQSDDARVKGIGSFVRQIRFCNGFDGALLICLPRQADYSKDIRSNAIVSSFRRDHEVARGGLYEVLADIKCSETNASLKCGDIIMVEHIYERRGLTIQAQVRIQGEDDVHQIPIAVDSLLRLSEPRALEPRTWLPTEAHSKLLTSVFANNQAPFHDKAAILGIDEHKVVLHDVSVDINKSHRGAHESANGTGAAAGKHAASELRAVVIKVSGKSPYLTKVFHHSGRADDTQIRSTTLNGLNDSQFAWLENLLEHHWGLARHDCLGESRPKFEEHKDLYHEQRLLPLLEKDGRPLQWAMALKNALLSLTEPYDNFGFDWANIEGQLPESLPEHDLQWWFLLPGNDKDRDQPSTTLGCPRNPVDASFLHLTYANRWCPFHEKASLFVIEDRHLVLQDLVDPTSWGALESRCVRMRLARTTTLTEESGRFHHRDLTLSVPGGPEQKFTCASGEQCTYHLLKLLRVQKQLSRPIKVAGTGSAKVFQTIEPSTRTGGDDTTNDEGSDAGMNQIVSLPCLYCGDRQKVGLFGWRGLGCFQRDCRKCGPSLATTADVLAGAS